MHYLVSFAHGLQSRVLIPIVNKLRPLMIHLFKHPIKSLFFIIKCYLMLVLLVVTTLFFIGSVNAQSIYDRSTSYPPSQSEICVVSGDAEERTLSQFLSDGIRSIKDNGCPVQTGSCNSGYSQSFSPIDTGNAMFCGGRLDYSWTRVRYSNGNITSEEDFSTSINVNAYKEMEETCPSQQNPLATWSKNGVCYDVNELEDNDSCDIGEPDLLGTASGPDLVCQSKPDGSKCAMKKYQVNGQYAYTQNLEPSACLTGENNLPDYENSNFPPTVDNGQCQNIGNGVEACPADPNQVCDSVTGACETGCGSFQIGATATFMCLKDIQNNCNPVTDTCPTEPTEPPICDDPLGCDEPPVCDDPLGCDSDGEGQGEETDLTPLIDAQNNTTQAVVNTTNAVKALGSGLSQLNQTGSAQLGELTAIKDELKNTGAPVDFNDPTELYTPNDYEQKNFGTLLSAAVTEMQNAEISKAINSFFDVSLSGTCPTYTADIPYIGTSITIDQFCGSVMNSIWPIISTIILLVFSVLAFRVAIL